MDMVKTFKCVLWANGERLNYLNKKNPKDEKHDMPFIMQTRYIDIESYEKLQKSYRLAPPGTYCVVEEVEKALEKGAIEVSRQALKMNPEGSL
mgnify:CR=1 FL=1